MWTGYRVSLNRCAPCFIPTLGYVKEGALGLVAEGKSGLDSRPYDLISLDCSTKHSSFREIINSSKKKLGYCEAG